MDNKDNKEIVIEDTNLEDESQIRPNIKKWLLGLD